MEVCATVLSVILLLAFYLYRIFKKKADFFREHGIPSRKSIPFFGNMAPCVLGVTSLSDLVKNSYDSVPPNALYVGFMEFTNPKIIIRDIDLMNDITIKNFDHFSDRVTFADPKTDPLFAKMLLSMKGADWHAMRATLSPSFTTSKIKFMFQLVGECAAEFAKALQSQCEGSPISVDTKDVFSKVANDIIVTTALGVSVDSMKDPDNDFFSKGHYFAATGYSRLMKIFISRTQLGSKVFGLFKPRVVPEAVQNFFRNMIASNVSQRKSLGVVRSDMIHLLMEAKFGEEKRDLTMDEIAAQALIFYFAGFDTISTTLSYLTYLLAKNPEVQKKLQDTIDKVHDECGGDIGYEALQQLPYMDAVIYESTRLFPAVFQTDRVCTRRYELPPALPGLEPFVVEPGTVMVLPMFAIHRDPRYFPNPEEFIPERFLDANGQITKPAGYFGFGRGPRNCIATRFALIEMKSILFQLLARTSFKLCDKTVAPTSFCQATNQHNPVDPIVLLMESR